MLNFLKDYLKLGLYILEHCYVYSKIERKVKRLLCTPCPLHTTYLIRLAHLLQSMNLRWHIIITKVLSLHCGSRFVFYIVWIWTNVKWLVSITAYHTAYFYCPENLLCSAYLSSHSQCQHLATTYFFIVFIVSPSPAYHIVGITVCSFFRLALFT